MIAGFLVFFMQAGFALIETGFTRAKNVANIMMKHMMDFGIGTIVFWAVGFAFMYGSDIGGAIAAMVIAWIKIGKPNLGYTLNGALAGLVSITPDFEFRRPKNCTGLTEMNTVLQPIPTFWALMKPGICLIWI